jgi:hypothetical protein
VILLLLIAAPWLAAIGCLVALHGRAVLTGEGGRAFPSYGEEALRRLAVR